MQVDQLRDLRNRTNYQPDYSSGQEWCAGGVPPAQQPVKPGLRWYHHLGIWACGLGTGLVGGMGAFVVLCILAQCWLMMLRHPWAEWFMAGCLMVFVALC